MFIILSSIRPYMFSGTEILTSVLCFCDGSCVHFKSSLGISDFSSLFLVCDKRRKFYSFFNVLWKVLTSVLCLRFLSNALEVLFADFCSLF